MAHLMLKLGWFIKILKVVSFNKHTQKRPQLPTSKWIYVVFVGRTSWAWGCCDKSLLNPPFVFSLHEVESVDVT